MNLQEWAVNRGFEKEGFHLNEGVQRMFLESGDNWVFTFLRERETLELIHAVAKEVGGIVAPMPHPKDNLR